MFYRNPVPQYKYAIQDGYDPYGWSTDGLVLYLPLWALKDGGFKSVDAYKHTCTKFGALWQPDGHLFDGDDYLSMPADTIATVINGATATSWLAWINIAASAGDQVIIRTYGVNGSAGTAVVMQIDVDEKFEMGGRSDSDNLESEVTDAALSTGAWHFCMGGLDYTGDTIYLSVDGGAFKTKVVTFVSDTFVAGSQANIDSIGSDVGVGSFIANGGKVGEFWAYRRLLPFAEVQHIRNSTIWRYQ